MTELEHRVANAIDTAPHIWVRHKDPAELPWQCCMQGSGEDSEITVIASWARESMAIDYQFQATRELRAKAVIKAIKDFMI